jgi:uncharacterized protein (DUF1800 family)
MAQPVYDPAIAVSRFGLGATSQGVGATGDPHAVLLSEIAQGPPQLQGLAATPDLLTQVFAYQKAKRMARQAANAGDANGPKKPDRDDNPVRPALLAEMKARFDGTVTSPVIGFNERMTQFWANHFAVSTKKSQELAAIAGAFEREAIRPHVFGKFSDLLLAVETHPAMLLYLDNQTSIGPDSPAARKGKGGAKRGLNENLAREIMELHTLGVGSGYTQTDVTTFAKVITGWSVARDNDRNASPGTFVFHAYAHEPGAQTLLGKRYAEGGMEQGKAVLLDLARHPATAQHIATKLARYFIADDPPPELVTHLRETFISTDGDLAEVSRALIEAPESWSPQRVKMRSPLEYCCALIRATGVSPKPQAIEAALNAMGQPLWQPAGPNGFPDTVAAWNSPEGMATRMDVANSFADMLARRRANADARALAQSLFGSQLSDATAQAVARAETQSQALALLFMSPEFMRR